MFMMPSKAFKIRVIGVVQGVGFRPFIYRLARRFGFKGYVLNLGGSEVEIHLEDVDGEGLEKFIGAMMMEKPPRAVIMRVNVFEAEVEGCRGFEIRESVGRVSERSMIPPDIAICGDCVEEVLNGVDDRFHGYHWNSCAWCGPRFSMMIKTPYDRCNTSMAEFKFCSECEADYSNPENLRRFHGQGISCRRCGPRTHVYRVDGVKIEVEDPVEFALNVILDGGFIALKGVGGFHIACLASRDDVVGELRARKRRPSQPFALMARDYNVVLEIADPPMGAREILESPSRPIVVMPRRGGRVSELVAPGLSTIGVMLPYTGFQFMLLRGVPDGFIIMTSGNRSGRPMCTSLESALRELKGIVDYIIDHERKIMHRVDDSVIRFTDGQPTFLRRGRGYAPEWIEIGFRIPEAAAVGGELQSAGGVGWGDKIVLTQYIGDVDEPGQLWELENEIKWFIEVYRLKPRIIALDMHPQYSSRLVAERLGVEYGARLIEVQHHHAHAATVLGELKAHPTDEYIAITIDGTGYGENGEIWGGEVLLASMESYRRIGSIKPFTLPGGDSSTIYPAKTLISLMACNGYCESEVLKIIEKYGLERALPHGIREAELTFKLASKGVGVKTSSLGRILDAFSTLLGICLKRTFEGEPAIKLEAYADKASNPTPLEYQPKIIHGEICMVDVGNLLEWTLKTMGEEEKNRIALTIQYSLGKALGEIAVEKLRGNRRVKDKIILTGGAAVNTYITRGVKEALKNEDITLIQPRKTPPGDGGISLGQILVAAAKTLKMEN